MKIIKSLVEEIVLWSIILYCLYLTEKEMNTQLEEKNIVEIKTRSFSQLYKHSYKEVKS